MMTNCPSCEDEVVATPQYTCPWCSTNLAQHIQNQIDSVWTASHWTQTIRELEGTQ